MSKTDKKITQLETDLWRSLHNSVDNIKSIEKRLNTINEQIEIKGDSEEKYIQELSDMKRQILILSLNRVNIFSQLISLNHNFKDN